MKDKLYRLLLSPKMIDAIGYSLGALFVLWLYSWLA